MREIKTQPARLHNAAGLLHMGTQHLAQSGLQQMRGGVIAHGRAARGLVDDGDQSIAQCESAAAPEPCARCTVGVAL